MHQEAYNWVAKQKQAYPELFFQKRVVEFGSYYINGTVRDFFNGCNYTGVDWRAGPMVDTVSPAHLYIDQGIDVVITTETLEHDVYWKDTIRNAFNILKRNGVLLVTCAGIGRPEHCIETGENSYYGNLSIVDLYPHISSRCPRFILEENHKVSSETGLPAHDTYAIAWKG